MQVTGTFPRGDKNPPVGLVSGLGGYTSLAALRWLLRTAVSSSIPELAGHGIVMHYRDDCKPV